jgi:ribonuclease-3
MVPHNQFEVGKKKVHLPLDLYGDKKKLSILNPNNQLITSQIINQIFENCGMTYKVQNLALFQQGLTHRSYVVINNPEIEYERIPGCIELQPECNERLEYLGDSILGTIISSYIYHRYPKEREGFLTKLKTKLVRTKMLAKFCSHMGLAPYILMSKHVEDVCDGRRNEAILENTFEAFMGTLNEDVYKNDLANYGEAMQVCCDFMINLLEETTDFRELISVNDNYKEQLLQYFQKNFGGIHVIYPILHVEGPTNKRIYTMGVFHPKHPKLLIGQGVAKKKVQAEQLASKMAMEYFEGNPHVPDDNDVKLDNLRQQQKQLSEECTKFDRERLYYINECETDPHNMDLQDRLTAVTDHLSNLRGQLDQFEAESGRLKKLIQDLIDQDETSQPMSSVLTAEDDELSDD